MRTRFVLLLALALTSACSERQLYDAGQAWQRNQCNRIPDKAEYERCMNSAATSYEAYKKETGTDQE